MRFSSDVSLKVKFAISLSCASLLFSLAFSFLVYRQAERKFLSIARQSLVAVVEHEWEHIDLRKHDSRKQGSAGTSHFKDVFLRIHKDRVLIYDSFPPELNSRLSLSSVSSKYLFHEATRDLAGAKFNIEGYYDLSSDHRYLLVLKRSLYVACLLALFLCIPLSLIFTRLLLKPFRHLAAQTSVLSAEKLSFRFPEHRVKDEYGLLIKNFNGLLNRLERSFVQVKRFALNASHELRTPLAVIISQGEMALRRERSPEDYRSALEKMVRPAKELREITTRLLVLAELHRLEGDVGPTQINGGEVIREAIETLRNAYPDRSELTIEHTDSVGMFRGRKEIFRIVLANLLENALKHANGRVIVSLSNVDNDVLLVVDDDGPGIGESGQEPTSPKKGAGIGLSIVKACLDSIDGKVTLDHSPLGGLRAQVLFPHST